LGPRDNLVRSIRLGVAQKAQGTTARGADADGSVMVSPA
jgi:hypothetical protein